MFVHIERQKGSAASEGVAVVGRPLIYELAVARRVGQQHPTGPASKCLTHGGEFCAPAIEGTEIARKGRAELLSRHAFVSHPSKNSSCRIIELVAMSSSRLSPFIRKLGAVLKSRPASCSVMRLSRLTAPP